MLFRISFLGTASMVFFAGVVCLSRPAEKDAVSPPITVTLFTSEDQCQPDGNVGWTELIVEVTNNSGVAYTVSSQARADVYRVGRAATGPTASGEQAVQPTTQPNSVVVGGPEPSIITLKDAY